MGALMKFLVNYEAEISLKVVTDTSVTVKCKARSG